MRIAIVHLSDIHLVKDGDVAVRRAQAIGDAARAGMGDAKHCFVLLSGDIANSGKSAQYKIADRFLKTVHTALETDGSRATVVLVPGNHDCDFTAGSKLRPLILANNAHLETPLDDDTIRACTSVQKAFFQFAARYGLEPHPSPDRMLSYSVTTDIEEQRVVINCYNTAWVSKLKEHSGDIFFPVPTVKPAGSDGGAALVISLFHHPYSWLAPDNRRAFAKLVENTSDLVFTGHEHVQGYYEVQRPSLRQDLHYVEGAILQDTVNANDSGFNVVSIDTTAGSYVVTAYQWQNHHYAVIDGGVTLPFVRNQSRLRSSFNISSEFNRILDDLGRDLHHSRKPTLELEDIFVYPQLRERSLNAQLAASKGRSPLIDSHHVLDHVIRKAHTLILAPNDSGKTSLCRVLYRDIRIHKDLVPVLLAGDQIAGHDYASLVAAANRAFCAQYSSSELEDFHQLPKDRRVLIVDDFHKYRLNVKAKSALVEAARSYFGTVVLVGDDILQYEELSEDTQPGASPYLGFSRCELQPFGYKLRERLIRRWLTIGREYTTDASEIDLEVRQWEHVVNTLVNVIPAYPLTLLVMLQSGQAARNHALLSGAYGYVYEALITRTIASVGEEETDTDTKYAFLSWLAYYSFTQEQRSMSVSTLLTLARQYLEQIELDLDPGRLVTELVQSQVLERRGADIAFRYDYYFYYFTARYLRDALASGSDVLGVRATLEKLADTLHYEPYANILVMYLYLNRDTELIQYLLRGATRILQEHTPCNLESDVEFLNKLDLSQHPRVLSPAAPTENRDRYLDEVDAASEETAVSTGLPEKVQYAEDLHPYLKLNIAFKTLQVLGQVLRNFPGSLPGPLKLTIAEECYRLGFRVLQLVVKSVEQSYSDVKEHIDALIRERRQIDPETSMPRSADHFIMWLCLGCSFGIIRRVSEAVGHQRLKRTYDEVLRRDDKNIAFRLVHFSIALDQYGEVSESVIGELKALLRDDPFAFHLLQDLGFYHMCMWSMKVREKQRLAALLGIDASSPRLLDSRIKLLKE